MDALLGGLPVTEVVGDPGTTEITALELDSRRVVPGTLFCCVPGRRDDGHRFAADAVDRGAVALLCERALDLPVTQAVLAPGAVRPALAPVAAAFHGHPADALLTVGVTGTNGKTTVTHLVREVLAHAGRPTGLIGTLAGERTTPEAPDLQRLLAGCRDRGDRAVALEVSSHALTEHRVDGIVFDVVAFTNLSRDHLDHHGTMDAYFEAKASLFDDGRWRQAVVFADDPAGARLLARLARRGTGPGATAVHRSEAVDVVTEPGRTSFRWRGRPVDLALRGAFNVDNALVAAAVAVAVGVDEDDVAAGLSVAGPVPGRMEVVGTDPCTVVVDYAHTPDGLAAALAASRGLAGVGGRVVCVVGCGGDRDRGKRPEMAAVATGAAELTVLTSDNPRSEDPAAILAEMAAGALPGADVVVEPDRARAIDRAVGSGRPGDVVLVAGKGHESTQTIGDLVLPFDDRTVAAEALRRRTRDGEARR
jgi:UDP-N-acetylmuramoyl-L-alanyl-D-glutamate--2,6-diaminopimelate ligase